MTVKKIYATHDGATLGFKYIAVVKVVNFDNSFSVYSEQGNSNLPF